MMWSFMRAAVLGADRPAGVISRVRLPTGCFRAESSLLLIGFHLWPALRALFFGAFVIAVALCGGCNPPSRLRTQARYEQGLVIILPGIEGKSPANVSIAKGLDDGGVRCAIEVYDWTTGAALFGVNLRYLERNKREARYIADRIMAYQDRYPGRPVHLIGHSGGGGVTILALEALPVNRQVTGAVLLAAAVAPEYDLRRALRRVDRAIYNYYSPYDVGFLKLGTTIMGTIEGRHTTAAGVRGFRIPWGLDDEGRLLYSERLRQQRYTSNMARSGHAGGHFGWADRRFVAEWLAPIIRANNARVRNTAMADSASESEAPRRRPRAIPDPDVTRTPLAP